MYPLPFLPCEIRATPLRHSTTACESAAISSYGRPCDFLQADLRNLLFDASQAARVPQDWLLWVTG